MIDPISYLPVVAWRTYFHNVLPVQGEPLQYTCDVAPIDITEPGAIGPVIDIGYHIVDNIGNVYRIIDITGTSVKVVDDFQCMASPNTGFQGIVYQSADLGRAPWLAPVFSMHLSRIALDKVRARETSILWRTREIIQFTGTNTPAIEDYQTEWAAVYGEYPSTTLVITNGSGIEQVRQDVPQRILDGGGKLDKIQYGLPFPLDGFIILSR